MYGYIHRSDTWRANDIYGSIHRSDTWRGNDNMYTYTNTHIYIEVTPGRQSRIVIQGEDVTQSPEAVLIRQALK
jgi:hypothetical protein